MKTCPTCAQSYPDSVAFCARDGARLAAPVENQGERHTIMVQPAGEFAQTVSIPNPAEVSDSGPTVRIDLQEFAQAESLEQEKAQAERRANDEAAAEMAARERAQQELQTAPGPYVLPVNAQGQLTSPWRRKKEIAVKLLWIVSWGILAQIIIGVFGSAVAVFKSHPADTPKSASEGWVMLCSLAPFLAWLVFVVRVVLFGSKAHSLQEPAISDDLIRGVRIATRLAIGALVLGVVNFAWFRSSGAELGWTLFWCSGPLGLALASFLFSRRWASQARRNGELAPANS